MALKNPPIGFILPPEDFFRRKQREVVFYFSTNFKLHLLHFLFSVLITLFFLGIMNNVLLGHLEYITLNYFFRMRQPIQVQPSDAIVHIDINEESLRAIGRWPWPRHNFAALTHILYEWGAKMIVFDMIFSEPSDEFNDAAFEEAIKEAGNVYLSVLNERIREKKKNIWIHSMPKFEKQAKGIGHINVYPSRDGLIRWIYPFYKSGRKEYPYLGIKVGYDYRGEEVASREQMDAPLSYDGRLLINWMGPWASTFRHIEFIDLIKSYADQKEGRQPLIHPEAVKNKICLIGLTAGGLTDIRANSLETAYPGVGIPANVINSIITKQYIQPLKSQWRKGILFFLGIFASFLFLFSRNFISLIAALGLGILWVRIAFLIFSYFHIWIPTISPIFLILALFVFSMVFSFTIGKKEQEKLFDLAAKDGLTGLYVIRHFRSLLNEAVTEAYKKQQKLSLMILDIDFFKKINDTYGHEAGDVALRYLATVLRDMTVEKGQTKDKNPVCRYGGEEFIILLKNCHLIDAAFNYGEKIRRYLEKNPCEFHGMKIPFTVSVGVATLKPLETIPDLMVHRADEALYRAKAEGRNRTCIEAKSGEMTEMENKHDA